MRVGRFDTSGWLLSRRLKPAASNRLSFLDTLVDDDVSLPGLVLPGSRVGEAVGEELAVCHRSLDPQLEEG
jgi:hypothetical protein